MHIFVRQILNHDVVYQVRGRVAYPVVLMWDGACRSNTYLGSDVIPFDVSGEDVRAEGGLGGRHE